MRRVIRAGRERGRGRERGFVKLTGLTGALAPPTSTGIAGFDENPAEYWRVPPVNATSSV